MRAADAHLTPQELELLLFGAADSSNWDAGGALAPEAQQHLKGCAVCQAVAERYRNAEEALKGLESGNNAVDRGQGLSRQQSCPAEATWLSLAAGLLNQDETARHVAHAATCDCCGPMLKEAMEDLAQHVTPEEQEALAQLPTGSTVWQRELAKKLAARSGSRYAASETPTFRAGENEEAVHRKPSTAFQWWPRLAWAVVVVAFVPLVWFTWLKTREPDVNELLAQAYTEQRTIELRMAGAEYSKSHISRGPGGSSLTRPTPLLDAEAKISHGLNKHPDDPDWLDKKGRAELMDGDYKAAIATLRRANDLRSAVPTVLTDLATAYFERAEAENHSTDYATAAQLLSSVLVQNPDDQIALFNRAIVYERLFSYQEAARDWERFLRLSSDEGWKEEARKRLQELQEKLKKSGEYDKPLMDYGEFSQSISVLSQQSWQAAELHIEDYLERAIRVWLPAAVSNQAPQEQQARALQAAQTLSVILSERHGDRWFQDVLGSAHSPTYARAVVALGEALDANAGGDPERAAMKATEAGTLFRLAGNPAGHARAREELIYALHRSAQGTRCVANAEVLQRTVSKRTSPWLAAQLLTEYSICSGMTGHLDEARAAIANAITMANRASYPQLHLRALGIAASLDTEMGRPDAAWAKDLEGLKICWSGSYSPQRAYQFYSDLGFFPESSKKWFVALALAREAAAHAAKTRNPATGALARFRLASAASAAHSNTEAIEEFEAAGKLYESLPSSKTTRTYTLDGQISLAELKALNGDWDVPLKRLADAEVTLSTVSDYSIPLRLYGVLGAIYFRQSRWTEARAAYTKAVKVSEQALRNLDGEGERLRWERETGRAYRGLLQTYIRQTGDLTGALEFWEWYKAAASRPPSLRDATLSLNGKLLVHAKTGVGPVQELDRIRGLLRGETVISYAELPDEVIAWMFDDRGIKAVRVPVTSSNLELLAGRFLDQCSDPKSGLEPLRANGRQLYAWLIAPVMQNTRANSQLTIEPDGEISRLPFSALVDENGRYMGERFAISLSPGIHYRARYATEGVLSSYLDALVVAAPALTDETGLKPLPDAIVEADAVAGRFHHAARLYGVAATPKAVEQALGHAELFHYAGHSFGNFGSAGLLLAGPRSITSATSIDPEVLNAERLSRVNLRHLRLAVLSACSTESDPDRVLTDPDELVRAFLQGGVPQVVASRWNADSTTTAELMRTFYECLLAGKSAAQALRIASGRLRQTRELSHPFYWAAFCAFGSSRQASI